MSAKIRIARGSKTTKGALLGGELFFETIKSGESGTLYIGRPDGDAGSIADLAIGGARAMESLHYKGVLTGSDLPDPAELGDFWIMSEDGTGSLAAYKTNDWLVCVGVSQFARVNNSGGSAAETTYSNATSLLISSNVQSAVDELAAKRLQYAGMFDASATEYPASPKPGAFYISSSIGTVSSVSYKQGDAAFYDGTTWTKIPFSFTFPADGIQGTGTTYTVPVFDSAHNLIDSSIVDNGTTVTIDSTVVVTGDVESSSLIINAPTLSGKATISAQDNAGNIAITLPAIGGTLQVVGADIAADLITYENTDTSIVATDVQAALTEIANAKLQYEGTISTGTAYPANPKHGGLYLVTADLTLDLDPVPEPASPTAYVKGDWALWDGLAWTRIPAGYTDAINTSFDNAGLKRPIDGTDPSTIVATDVQAALADLYTKKADLDGSGKVPTSQLPDAIVGALSYMGTWDASTAYPTTPAKGQYYIVNVAGDTGGGDYEPGDWIVYDGSAWQKIDNSDKISGILVGADTLVGVPEIAGAAPITVTASSGVITVGATAATKLASGVVQVGDGLAVNTGLISVDATDGIYIDANGKVAAYLNTNGLETDASHMLGIKASSNFVFTAGALDLADTTVVAGEYTKVTVDAKGRVTSGASLLVTDVPITASGASGATEIYNSTTGVIAGITITGPVEISKSGDAINLDFTQTDAVALDARFAVDSPTGFDWSSRDTGISAITSIVGAVNANRADLNEYVSLLQTQGSPVGSAAGANLIGVDGISGVTPTGGALAGNSALQAMLEGLKAYTDDTAMSAVTGTPYDLVMFDSAGTGIVDSAISQNSAGTVVTVDAKLSVGATSAAQELDVYGPTKFFKADGLIATTFAAPTGVAGSGLISTTQTMPDQDGQLLNDHSTIDGGVW